MISEAAERLGRFSCRHLRFILAASSGLVIAVSLIAPLLCSSGLEGISDLLYSIGKGICHQQVDRCIAVGPHHTAVCARCFGGYAGFLISSLVFSNRIRMPKWVVSVIAVGAIASVVDIILHMLHIYDTGNLYRLISGFLTGMGLGMVVFGFVSVIERRQSI